MQGLWRGCLAMLALACSAAAAAPPQRIISLLPSATETVCALGACDRLVGVDEFSQDPPQVRSLPQLGKTWQPDMERIVALKPDLVLLGRVDGVIARLQAARISYLVADAATIEQVQAVMHKVDGVLETGQASIVWQQMLHRLETVAAPIKARNQSRAPRVYLEVDPAMYAAGPRSFMGQLLSHLGVHNITPEAASPFIRLSPEFVLRADPDLIILAHHGSSLRKLEDRPGWQKMRAVQPGQKQHRVCQLTAEEGRTVTRPGPRLDEAAAIFAACLRRLDF